MEYRDRLQRTISHIELHMEEDIRLQDLATIACYSRSHFIWLFECATGLSPMEYVRKRKLAVAAAAIQSGARIMDTALRYGFSSQDAFTRCFHNEFGASPARYFKAGIGKRSPQAVMRLHEKGDDMKLKTLVASYAGKARVEMEQFLTEEVKNVIAAVAVSPLRSSEIDPEVLHELTLMRVLREDKGTVKLATAVFLESDMHLIREAAQAMADETAAATRTQGRELLDFPANVRCYIAGIMGIGGGTAKALKANGEMAAWKDRDGKYGHARVDFDELCDAYDQYGPDLLIINTNRGERYSAVIIGPSSNTFFNYLLEWKKAAIDDDAYRFAGSLTTHLTDAFALLAEGSLQSKALLSAAEAAHLAVNGEMLSSVVHVQEAKRLAVPMKKVADAVEKLALRMAPNIREILKKTTSGRQGVPAPELMVNFVRFARKLTAKRLYEEGYFTDQVPNEGAIAVFYENACSMIDVMGD